jgi:hypothetical protein
MKLRRLELALLLRRMLRLRVLMFTDDFVGLTTNGEDLTLM